MKLKLLEFIQNNSDWEDILTEHPYNLTIKRDNGYVIFKYSQTGSDFSEPIVQECRGTILWEQDMTPVCVPFFKFFNVQEQNAVDIDWSTARVLEKLDGSLAKLWYHNGGWHVSTNGTINAHNAELPMSIVDSQTGYRIDNYYDLFRLALWTADINYGEFKSKLDTDYTYMFELVSPYNRVVIPYTETKLYHIGSRNNKTLKEEELDIGIEKPKEDSLSTLEDCLWATERMPFSEEGYVVVDSRYNRVKIKSPNYVAAHHLKNNGAVTRNRILDIIRADGTDDFLSVYPEYTDNFVEIQDALSKFVLDISSQWASRPASFESRKEFALWATKTICPPVMFSLYDSKTMSSVSWLLSLSNEKILQWIGLE
jgi:hypothetical protein